jgi:hypothetical protein
MGSFSGQQKKITKKNTGEAVQRALTSGQQNLAAQASNPGSAGESHDTPAAVSAPS